MIQPAPTAPESRLNLGEVWRASKRHRALSIGVPLALLASTAFFLWWAEPVYESTTTIRVDQERSGVAIIEALSQLSSGSKIVTEMEELRSRTLAEEIVDSLALHVVVSQPRKVARATLFDRVAARPTERQSRVELVRTSDGVFRVSGDGRPAREVRIGEAVDAPGMTLVLGAGAAAHDRIVVEADAFAEAVEQLQDQLDVSRPNRDADMILVRYESTDRGLAQAVPDVAARRFIARRNNMRTREARSTAEFLEEQIAGLNDQLTTSEDELRAFREAYGVISISAQGEAQVTRLADMQADRELLDVDRQALASVIASLPQASDDPLAPSPYRALLGFPAILRNPAAGELLSALNEAESERASYLDRRTVEYPQVQQLTIRIQQIEQQLRSIAETYLQGLSETVRSLDRTLAGFSSELQQIPEHEMQLARLRRRTEVTGELYTSLQLRLKEAEILSAIDDPTVRVVDPAAPPREPIRPQVPLSMALALLGGLVLGVGAATAREQLESTVRTRDELQAAGGVPVLAAIPRLTGADEQRARFTLPWRGREQHANGPGRTSAKLLNGGMAPAAAEAYRGLRTTITFSNPEGAPRTLVITSPAPGDGKSTTAVNLAITLAEQGRSCLLIDSDMRRGRLHDTFDAAREPGLSNVLMGQLSLEEAMTGDASSRERPVLLTTGTLPPNPAELLGAPRMGELIARALKTFDFVILDAPPLNMVTDAAVVARYADGVVVVARAGITKRAALAFTFDQLSAVRARTLGSVLNDADPQRERHYGSYMDEYYGTHS